MRIRRNNQNCERQWLPSRGSVVGGDGSIFKRKRCGAVDRGAIAHVPCTNGLTIADWSDDLRKHSQFPSRFEREDIRRFPQFHGFPN
jgi:hypothetical protein